MSHQPGLEIFLNEKYQVVKNKRVGLVTNHTGVNKNFISNIDLFCQHPDINLVALYGPEHGVRGNTQAGVKVGDSRDIYTDLPVYSLYGKNKKPTGEILEDIDVLIYDIQDIGVRYYTYISTLFCCLESCAENDKEFIVLDRLNPIGCKVEGNLVKSEFKSFIGLYPIPQRHGLTVGELANWANHEFEIGADLKVIQAEGWHGEYFDELNLLWVPPSPNIPHFSTALAYPVTCLFEGTNISEGRGTTNPFEFIGAPWIDPFQLLKYLEEIELPGVQFRPVFFVPTFSKHQGEECGGVQLMIRDRDIINSYLTGLTLLKGIFELYPDKSNWLIPNNNSHKYFFDLHMGTDQVRKSLTAGKVIGEIIHSWEEERQEFLSESRKYMMY